VRRRGLHSSRLRRERSPPPRHILYCVLDGGTAGSIHRWVSRRDARASRLHLVSVLACRAAQHSGDAGLPPAIRFCAPSAAIRLSLASRTASPSPEIHRNGIHVVGRCAEARPAFEGAAGHGEPGDPVAKEFPGEQPEHEATRAAADALSLARVSALARSD
jgi:hypothetical protein